ncbi:MAG: penicillin-insensitive murein endopeptidase [Myxococcota bacterium]|nr:penicillin-insensitive murein endopeptidase [Myxococcota bacterium]
MRATQSCVVSASASDLNEGGQQSSSDDMNVSLHFFALLFGMTSMGCAQLKAGTTATYQPSVVSYYPHQTGSYTATASERQDVGVPQSGSLNNPSRLEPNPYCTVRQATNYGTRQTVETLQKALVIVHNRHRGTPKVHVGDISGPKGGPLPGHRSHQNGRDVDIGYYLNRGHDSARFRAATPETIDRARTWTLIQALIAQGNIQYIFMDHDLQRAIYTYAEHIIQLPKQTLTALFSFPHGRAARRGLIRHWQGHIDHMHVRLLPPFKNTSSSLNADDHAHRYRRYLH